MRDKFSQFFKLLYFIASVQAQITSSSSNLAIQEVKVDSDNSYKPVKTENFQSNLKLKNITCPELNHTFTDEPPFDIFGLPKCYKEIQPILELFLNDENKTHCFLDVRDLPNTNSSQCLQTLKNHQGTQKLVIIIHGFSTTHFLTPWLFSMKEAIQSVEKGTAVIILGWGTGGLLWNFKHYPQIAANTRYVSQALYQIMDNLHSEVDRPLYIHCIGHSLGAHICGLTGKLLKASMKTPTFNRISGMDPAGPRFFDEPKLNVTSASRLNATDADFVDVIHTDGKNHWHCKWLLGDYCKYGTLEPCGQVDFYPGIEPIQNGTQRGYGCYQPGCTNVTTMFFMPVLIPELIFITWPQLKRFPILLTEFAMVIPKAIQRIVPI